MANSDVADWVGEMLLEAVLDNPEKNNYLEIAKETIKDLLSSWPKMAEWLEAQRELGTRPKSLSAYLGVYWNAIHDWSVGVLLKDGQLTMCFSRQPQAHVYSSPLQPRCILVATHLR